MKRIKRKYETPLHRFDKERIEGERGLLTAYGLKTKRELWVTESLLRKYRRLARELAAKKDKERERMLVDKMVRLGLINENSQLDDVLGMNINNFLERRFQMIVFRKGLAKSVNHARQLITHGKVLIGEKKVKYPSYIVSRDEEGKIQLVSGLQPKTKVIQNA